MGKKTAKPDPTTREQLAELDRDALAALATKQNVTVLRGDGEEGDPLKEDFINALAAPRGRGVRQPAKFVDAQGRPVNEDGERIDARGNAIEVSEDEG